MRLAAVILPDLGTGPDEPIRVSHWFARRGERVWEGDRLVEVRGREDDRVACGAVLGLVAVDDEDGEGDPADDPATARPSQP